MMTSIGATLKTEKAMLPRWSRPDGLDVHRKRAYYLQYLLAGLIFLVVLTYYQPLSIIKDNGGLAAQDTRVKPIPFEPVPARLRSVQDCALKTFEKTGYDFLETAQPLSVSEFVNRRDRLAQALAKDELDAFAVEPGYTFSYYANVTQKDWEVWEPEERPFVMIIRPEHRPDGSICANTSFLVPAFEAERARLLHMPFEEPIRTVTYEEHWDPYKTLAAASVFSDLSGAGRQPKVMVDEEMRDFISRGLNTNGFEVHGLSGAVERVRQTKTPSEVGILRAVNTGTVEAVRAVRECLVPGLSEDDVALVLDNTMRAAGMEPFFDIVLFDEDASNPHGGTDGQKKLEKETMVLIDVGAHLHGYSSDICRSFFPPFFRQPQTTDEVERLSSAVKEKLRVWDIVMQAQNASLLALRENSTAAAVDIAARDIIERADGSRYNGTFTHRVGHGIGIKAHESPYLNKGNFAAILKAGMTFTSEPGIYLVDKFGVRHEDVLLVREEGLPEVLTGQRATSAWEP